MSPSNRRLGCRASMCAAAVAAIVLAGASAATPAEAAPTAQGGCPGNLLVNGDFDGGSHKTESEGTSLSSAVADGWSPWFVRGGESVNREPEFKVEQVAIGGDPARVRSGGQSMKWFTTWATHDAGIYQRVAVRSGTRVTFTAYAMGYSGEGDIFDHERKTFVSDPQKPGNYAMSVGIEPTGALPSGMGAPPPASVVWGESTMVMDQWMPLSVSAVAQSSAVTVYLRGNPYWGVKHNDSFWEDACLVVGGRAPVAAAPAEAPAQAPAEQPQPAQEVAPTAAVAEADEDEGDDAQRTADEASSMSPDATAMPERASSERRDSSLPPVVGKFWAVRR